MSVKNLLHFKCLRTEVVHSPPPSRLTPTPFKGRSGAKDECSACISNILLDIFQVKCVVVRRH